MFDHVPGLLRGETAATEAEADDWYAMRQDRRRPPELLPADVVTRAIDAEVRAGRGFANGGVHLDIATRRSPGDIRKLLPSTCRRFEQLAGLDITREPIEVAPACHYSIGGVRVEAETAATSVPGLYAAGEVAAGVHGASRLGGNSLADLLVFGRRAGLHAALYAKGTVPVAIAVAGESKAVARIVRRIEAPLGRSAGENPYSLQRELQECMHAHAGIFRTRAGLEQALDLLADLRRRAANIAAVGSRLYNPAWHLALDLGSMLDFAQATTLAALAREESRGCHARADFPAPSAEFGANRVVLRPAREGLRVRREAVPAMPGAYRKLMVPDELMQFFEEQSAWLQTKSTSGSGAATPAAGNSRVTG